MLKWFYSLLVRYRWEWGIPVAGLVVALVFAPNASGWVVLGLASWALLSLLGKLDRQAAGWHQELAAVQVHRDGTKYHFLMRRPAESSGQPDQFVHVVGLSSGGLWTKSAISSRELELPPGTYSRKQERLLIKEPLKANAAGIAVQPDDVVLVDESRLNLHAFLILGKDANARDVWLGSSGATLPKELNVEDEAVWEPKDCTSHSQIFVAKTKIAITTDDWPPLEAIQEIPQGQQLRREFVGAYALWTLAKEGPLKVEKLLLVFSDKDDVRDCGFANLLPKEKSVRDSARMELTDILPDAYPLKYQKDPSLMDKRSSVYGTLSEDWSLPAERLTFQGRGNILKSSRVLLAPVEQADNVFEKIAKPTSGDLCGFLVSKETELEEEKSPWEPISESKLETLRNASIPVPPDRFYVRLTRVVVAGLVLTAASLAFILSLTSLRVSYQQARNDAMLQIPGGYGPIATGWPLVAECGVEVFSEAAWSFALTGLACWALASQLRGPEGERSKRRLETIAWRVVSCFLTGKLCLAVLVSILTPSLLPKQPPQGDRAAGFWMSWTGHLLTAEDYVYRYSWLHKRSDNPWAEPDEGEVLIDTGIKGKSEIDADTRKSYEPAYGWMVSAQILLGRHFGLSLLCWLLFWLAVILFQYPVPAPMPAKSPPAGGTVELPGRAYAEERFRRGGVARIRQALDGITVAGFAATLLGLSQAVFTLGATDPMREAMGVTGISGRLASFLGMAFFTTFLAMILRQAALFYFARLAGQRPGYAALLHRLEGLS